MKRFYDNAKLLFIGGGIILSLILVSCTYDELNQRVTALETEVSDLRTAVNTLSAAYESGKVIKEVIPVDDEKGGWVIVFSDNTSITLHNGGKGDSFIEGIENNESTVIIRLVNGVYYIFPRLTEEVEPKLMSISFRMADNPLLLVDDISSEILGDSIAECWIRHLVINKYLIPLFEYEGDSIVINNQKYISGDMVDFKTPVKIKVLSHQKSKEYTVLVHSFTGLPVVWIETENRKEIVSKEEYVNASFKLVENVLTRSAGDVIEDSVSIKGRGTSSWNISPKKSYRLKFDKKISLLNEPKDKSWVLIANHFDKTMIRNMIAYYMGGLSNLDYTPRFHFVDLMLNGRYDGTYMLGDKLKISNNRVNVGDDGFLVEISHDVLYEEGVYFYTDSLICPVHIKYPDVIEGDENYLYVKDAFVEAEKALFMDSFMDPNNGWQKYLDISSFVDWWIIHEITKNADAIAFYKSCYLSLKRGDKIKIGPIWDFDLSFGNGPAPGEYDIEGFTYMLYNNLWYKRLFQDPTFVQLVKERYSYFYALKNDMLREINEYANYLRYSVEENENRWHILYTTTYYHWDVWGNYNNEIQYMKTWLIKRMDWLNDAINQLN